MRARAGAWRRRCSWLIPTPQSESPAACGRSAIADFAAYGFAAQSLLTPGTARTPRLADVRAAARWGEAPCHRRCGAYAAEWAPWPAVGAWQLVGNVFFAHFWLGEPVMRTDLIGMGRACAHSQAPPAHRARLLDSSALVVNSERRRAIGAAGTGFVLSGVVIIAVFASKGAQCFDIPELKALYRSPTPLQTRSTGVVHPC